MTIRKVVVFWILILEYNTNKYLYIYMDNDEYFSLAPLYNILGRTKTELKTING